MAWKARAIVYQVARISDRPGEGAALTAALGDAGVDLLAFHAFPLGRGRAQVDLVAKDGRALAQAARAAKLRLSRPKQAFLVQGDDRPGAVAQVLARVAKARVNVTAVTGLAAGRGRFAAILWVKPRDQRRAARALGA
jgi:hypothetical protein